MVCVSRSWSRLARQRRAQVSDCDRCQATCGCHGCCFWRMALAITTSFRATAVMMTYPAFASGETLHVDIQHT
jgi:hypothetical protein